MKTLYEIHLGKIDKIKKIVESCVTMVQLENAVKVIYTNYSELRSGPARYVFINILDLPVKQSKKILKAKYA
jgi:hypothetical protein